jgi:hypothetical protein
MAEEKAQPKQWKYTGFANLESNFFKMSIDRPNITASRERNNRINQFDGSLAHGRGVIIQST